MYYETLPARFRAVTELQQVRAKYSPGSFRYEQAEVAIDLVLSPKRAVTNFLVHNALRDARKLIGRDQDRRQCIPLEPPTDEVAVWDLEEFSHLRETITPQDHAVADSFLESLIRACARASAHSRRVIEGWLLGETAVETARQLNLSLSYIGKIRRQVRTAARALLAEESMT